MEFLVFIIILFIFGCIPAFLFSYFLWNSVLETMKIEKVISFRKTLIFIILGFSLIGFFRLTVNLFTGKSLISDIESIIFMVSIPSSALLGLNLRLAKMKNQKRI